MKDRLTLLAGAVGSFPHKTPEEAMNFIFEKLPNFPVLPQLANVDKKEDMIAQITEGIPGLVFDESDNRWYIEQDGDEFFEKLEEFYLDYDAIVNEGELERLEKYAISEEYCSSLPIFLKKISETKPIAVKGQITGPFTFGTTIVDRDKKCSYYDDTAKEILIKGLTLKALWQVKTFKAASPESIPVIFLDEPSISQYGTSAFITITREDIINAISEISEILKKHGAVVGVHCCGKTDWSIIAESNVDIINLDGYYFAESLSLYAKQVKEFLEKGGYIAWGMTPTMDVDALKETTLEILLEKFEEAKSYLIAKGINEDLILKSSFITPACGCGSLNEEMTYKAIDLTAKLAQNLSQKAGIGI